MIRSQMSWKNEDLGTVYSPWRCPRREGSDKARWHSAVSMMGDALALLGWSMDTDVAGWGRQGQEPEGREEWDAPLEWVSPAQTQCPVAEGGGRSLLQDAAAQGWHWVSQIIGRDGTFREDESEVSKEKGRIQRTLTRILWQAVLAGPDGNPSPVWDPGRGGQTGNRCRKRGAGRDREYELQAQPWRSPTQRAQARNGKARQSEGAAKAQVLKPGSTGRS